MTNDSDSTFVLKDDEKSFRAYVANNIGGFPANMMTEFDILAGDNKVTYEGGG
tara:strand:- start:11922 stop:12080 length:159 start_codon:yes stop_codon:yes gene_type:complete